MIEFGDNAHTRSGSTLIAPSPAVAASRQRCLERGLRPEEARPQISHIGSDHALQNTDELTLARPLMEDIYQFLEGTQAAVSFANADARVLDVVGDAAFVRHLDTIGWTPGSIWSEEHAGTNALALALREAFPMQVRGRDHYSILLQPYCTAAAPVHDSLGGLVGALVIITRAEDGTAHTLALASAAAGSLTNQISMQHWLGSANELLLQLQAILQSLSEGIVLLQRDSTIKHMNARAGHMLGLVPPRALGRRMSDLLDVPAPLSSALALGTEMHDEEVIFKIGGTRVACLCSLRAVSSATSATMASPLSPAGLTGLHTNRGHGIRVSPADLSSDYVLMLRSVERMQRIVHRISGAEARMRFDNIVGQSPKLLHALRLARIAAESESTVLLLGETGTGKEIFAQSIHSGSQRANGPFVAINCAAIPRELISSELFGYEGGAFTGADRQGRPGKFELAHGGTLFLDEIGDMPPDLQSTLLRAIETRTIVRVGGRHIMPVDVRIIAATHRDLTEEVQHGHFRSDLFFRLNVFPINIPPLYERSGDIPLLLSYLLQRLSARLHRSLAISPEALAAMEAYSWPGNVRELENVIERSVYISDRNTITLRDLPEVIQQASVTAGQVPHAAHRSAGEVPPEPFALVDAGTEDLDLRHKGTHTEVALIQRVLAMCDGNTMRAADMLGISRTTLWRKRQRYHL